MASMTGSITSILPLLLLVLLFVPSSSSHVKFDLKGNVYPEGHISVAIKIGDPAKEYYLDVDTGSILTWLQCHDPSCRWPQRHPLYQLTPGQPLPRNDPLCQPGLRPVPDQMCRYGIPYLGGHSNGLLIRDKFTLPSPHAQHSIAFGCGYDNVPTDQAPVDGVLALGRSSPVNLVSQLKKEHVITKDVIAHCISTRGGGFLHIGDYEHFSSPITWVYIDNKAQQGHYSPILGANLHFGSSGDGTLISNHQIKVIFDSGSTFTYLDQQTYKRIEGKVLDTLHRSLREDHDNTLNLCWKGPNKFTSIFEVKPLFKPIFLVFGKGSQRRIMEIPPENYLIISQYGNVCFGILQLPMGWKNTMLLGAITMQDRIVIYDNEGKGRVGWAHHSC
nr:unnamed protein product [Digitaria exilis]